MEIHFNMVDSHVAALLNFVFNSVVISDQNSAIMWMLPSFWKQTNI